MTTVLCGGGGGTVIKGQTVPNSIYAGNPAKRIGDVENFAKKYID